MVKKVSTKKCLLFFLLNVVLGTVSCLIHWIPTLSIWPCMFITEAVQNMDVVDIHTRQRVVIEFLTADGSSPIQTHRCLSRACGDDATDVSSHSESIILKKWKGHWWLCLQWPMRHSSNERHQRQGWLIDLWLPPHHERGTRCQLVEALHYKAKGCRFNSQWCHWNFSLI
jgi:hypothetical protein